MALALQPSPPTQRPRPPAAHQQAEQPPRDLHLDRWVVLGDVAGVPEHERPQPLVRVEDERGGFLARADAELPEGRRDVTLDRALGEEQTVGDLAVVQSLDHEREDLALSM